jgi:hypothetical protein
VGASLSPPPPRIRLRVGVTGHREPPKLPIESEAPLRAILDRILTAIIETARTPDHDFPFGAAASAGSEFVVVSSLAEGSDRLVAEAGLARGYTLEVVLPFARAEYARDFRTPEYVRRKSPGRPPTIPPMRGGSRRSTSEFITPASFCSAPLRSCV